MATNRRKNVAPLYELLKKSNLKAAKVNPVAPAANENPAPPAASLSGQSGGSGSSTAKSTASPKTAAASTSFGVPDARFAALAGQSSGSESSAAKSAANPKAAASSSYPEAPYARFTALAGLSGGSGSSAAKSTASPAASPKAATPPSSTNGPEKRFTPPGPGNSGGKPISTTVHSTVSTNTAPVLLDQIMAQIRPIYLIAGIILSILFIAVLVFFMARGNPGGSSPDAQQPFGNPGSDLNPRLEPMPNGMNNQPQLPPVSQGSEAPNPAPQVGSQAAPGQVIPAADIPRSPNLVYLVILTTQPEYAQNAADFLAQHGIDVTIEQGLGSHVTVVSVQGFAQRSSQEALEFRRRVVEIGELFPGAHRGQSVWGDAYYSPIHRNE
jgi:hypothetical protein